MLALLRGVGDKWRIDLLNIFTAAGWTDGVAPLVLFKRQDDQRFLPAIRAFIVIHRHTYLGCTVLVERGLDAVRTLQGTSAGSPFRPCPRNVRASGRGR